MDDDNKAWRSPSRWRKLAGSALLIVLGTIVAAELLL